jgi:CBS domain-containing protein
MSETSALIRALRLQEQGHAQLSLLIMTNMSRLMQHRLKFFHANEKGEVVMNAYELCQRNVVTVRRHEELATAARMMRERNVGALVVVEPAGAPGGERPIGMLTDRDIVTHVIVRGADPRNLVVDDVMTRHPVTVSASASLEDALHRMRSSGVRRVTVLDDRGRLAGILALDDIFEHMAQRVPFAATPIRREVRLEQGLLPLAMRP